MRNIEIDNMAHTLKWFTNRIGKKIFRDDDGCGCKSCNNVVENGLIVFDESHAQYLEMIDNEFWACGTKLNYRDKK